MASRVLAFLRDESNRALLGWIGGGLVVQQIQAAFTTMRDGANAASAAYYETQLPKARALAGKLAKR